MYLSRERKNRKRTQRQNQKNKVKTKTNRKTEQKNVYQLSEHTQKTGTGSAQFPPSTGVAPSICHSRGTNWIDH